MLEHYIGTKEVQAAPCYGHNGKAVSTEEMGVLLKQGETVFPGYRIVYPDGYVSWCPKEEFEKAYRRTDGMTIGLAIEAAIKGHKIAREGWNGKGMFVVYQKGYPQGIPCNKQTAEAWGITEGELFRCEPYLQIKMTNGSHAMWVPSINDCLADDWMIVE